MSQNVGKNNNKVYRLVLTGGPCGGKTTGQARICNFFENLGWKVFRVPETATVLIGGGVKWTEFSEEEAFRFQEMLLQTMLQIEQVYFNLAANCSRNCLIICDRGTMDASAYLTPEQWERMKKENDWNNVELRDNRYNQVIHMVSAANGAEKFYETAEHATRYENIEHARKLDNFCAQAWVGHPYFDVINNTTGFEDKVKKMIAAVCNRLGIDAGDRLASGSRKRKFLVKALPEGVDLKITSINGEGLTGENGLPLSMVYPQFQDFIVIHDYLVTPNSKMQARIRRRGQSVRWDSNKGRWDVETDNRLQVSRVLVDEGQEKMDVGACDDDAHLFMYGTDHDFSHWTYTHTIRRPEINKESPEVKMQISSKEYKLLLAQRDDLHHTIYKKRRSFLWNNQYFQMDIYQEPCHPRCEGLILLETYTTMRGDDLLLPDFLDIIKEVTHDSSYSMFTLSRKTDAPALVPSSNANYSFGVVNGDVHGDNHGNGVVSDNHEGLTNGITAQVINGDVKTKTSASVM